MQLTPEQLQVGKDNFNNAIGVTRREFLSGVAAGGTSLGAMYFGYKALEGKPVRVGFIGTGDEGNILIHEHPPEYMEIVAIADLRPTNRERAMNGDGNDVRMGLKKKLGDAKAAVIAENSKDIVTHRDLIAKKDELGLEAVVIAVPLNQHAPIAMECMQAGLHVLTEKLMAKTVMQCKEMIRLAREKDLRLAVGHQRHYSVLYDNANALVKTGVLGDLKYIRAQWHRNNSFPGSDSWRKVIPKGDESVKDLNLSELGYTDLNQLVNWRLYNETGGGLMAELGSHQLDACSIFLGKVHPLAVQGYGGRNYYGVDLKYSSDDKKKDNREIDDHIYVTFEFPGLNHEKDPQDKCIVTYSSINTNVIEPYGELLYGSRGTLIMKTEKDALLYKEEGKGSQGGGPDQRLWVVGNQLSGGPVVDAYETTAPSAVASVASTDKVSRGYREEMEHFCYVVRTGGKQEELRCRGEVAMADAIMAITANLAMKHQRRIEFRPEWFDWQSDAVPETDVAELVAKYPLGSWDQA